MTTLPESTSIAKAMNGAETATVYAYTTSPGEACSSKNSNLGG